MPAAKKKTTAKKNTPPPSPPPPDLTPTPRSATGAELIEGRPYFATHNGTRMNRPQYLTATRPQRKAAFVEALRASPPPELDDETVAADGPDDADPTPPRPADTD